jgi:hypothetical protein
MHYQKQGKCWLVPGAREGRERESLISSWVSQNSDAVVLISGFLVQRYKGTGAYTPQTV